MIRFSARLAVAIMASLLAFALAPLASATEEPPASDPGPVTEEFPGEEPAVIVEEASAAEDEPAWTFRYLVPTVLAITVAVIGVVLIVYAFRIRGRFRVVN